MLPYRLKILEFIYVKNSENWRRAIILEDYSEHEQNTRWYILTSCWYTTASNNSGINTNYVIAANYLVCFIYIFADRFM